MRVFDEELNLRQFFCGVRIIQTFHPTAADAAAAAADAAGCALFLWIITSHITPAPEHPAHVCGREKGLRSFAH